MELSHYTFYSVIFNRIKVPLNPFARSVLPIFSWYVIVVENPLFIFVLHVEIWRALSGWKRERTKPVSRFIGRGECCQQCSVYERCIQLSLHTIHVSYACTLSEMQILMPIVLFFLSFFIYFFSLFLFSLLSQGRIQPWVHIRICMNAMCLVGLSMDYHARLFAYQGCWYCSHISSMYMCNGP